MLKAFDHVNLRTARLDEMIAFYTDVLGLQSGWRPDFPFPGAWMYLHDHAIVHLVGEQTERRNEDVKLEHFAFSAKGLPAFRAKLDARGLEHYLAEVPGAEIIQVNLHDPDGNHIHIDFALSEDR